MRKLIRLYVEELLKMPLHTERLGKLVQSDTTQGIRLSGTKKFSILAATNNSKRVTVTAGRNSYIKHEYSDSTRCSHVAAAVAAAAMYRNV